MGWGITLLLIWAAVLTGGVLWLLARTVATAAARKRHTVFSHGRHVYTPMQEVASECYWVSADGDIWVSRRKNEEGNRLRDDEAHRRGCYRI